MVFAKTASRDSCPIPDAEGCLFRPVMPSVRDGVLTEINSPLWAHGLNILTARGGQWSLLLQHAAGDPARLRQIQVARGYRPGWVFYASQDASANRGAA